MPTLAMVSEPDLHARAKDPDMSWDFEEGDEIRPGLYALKLLGGGRRYEAYLAHDEGLLALVVAKILRPGRAADAASLKGLAAEFHALRALNHPVIARGFDATLTGDRPHITLGFLEGPRLSTLVRKYGPLPLEQLIPLAVQLCSALHYMHNQRMTHLDVKPRNIIMGAPPRLIDLSIARSFEDAAALTVPVGTDAYMAPEQCDPTGAYGVGRAADIWGLGATLFEAATGMPPFPASGEPQSHYPQLYCEPRPFDRTVPAPIAQLIKSCLHKNPVDRPSARELATTLEALLAALPRRPVLGRLRPRWR